MFLQIGKITGEEWKNMTEAQKAPYEEVARKQKEEYQKQMEVYKQKKTEVRQKMHTSDGYRIRLFLKTDNLMRSL